MQWTDEGILLHLQPLGERKRLATFFCAEQGLVKGVVSVRKKQPLHITDVYQLRYQARLTTQLGQLYLEGSPLYPNMAIALQDTAKLHLQQYACALLKAVCPEHHRYPKLYVSTRRVLQEAVQAERLFKWELLLLDELGYELDLSQCAVTNKTTDLAYVSPRTGRAVSREAGEPYKDKLLPYPTMLQGASPPRDVQCSFAVTAYFLQKTLLAHVNAAPVMELRQRVVGGFR